MKLAEQLKVILGSTYVFTAKAHSFHWNVESTRFSQLHELFSDIYTDSYGAIDPLAEYIRALDEFAPTGTARMVELSKIVDQPKIPKDDLMVKELLTDTETLIAMIKPAFTAASEAGEQGIANFLADRLSSHGKLRWQLKATLK